MSEKNKELVRNFIETVINKRQEHLAADFIAPDYIDHNSSAEPVGIDGMLCHIRAVRSTYPDLKVVIHDQIAEGEKVVTHISIIGTHEGRWLGMTPTYQRVSIDAVNIDRVKNGKIIEHRGMANTLEALLEIGAVKPA